MNSEPPQNGNSRDPRRPLQNASVGPRTRPAPGAAAPTTGEPVHKRLTPRSPRAALEPEPVPPPKRPSQRARHRVVIAGNVVFTGLALLVIALGALLYIGNQRFDAPGPLAQDKVVNVPRGLGTRQISNLLVREGVIDHPWIFLGSVIVLHERGALKHGEYKFAKHASIADVVEAMIEGKVVRHDLTIPEGLTSEQIVQRLLANKVLSGQIATIPLEGTLLPDTYEFTRGTTREQLIERMQQADQRVVKEIWAHHAPGLPLKTPQQLVTLASIVEKETGRPDERTRVAAVFINRLRRNMRLQSDPTIIYGLTGGKGPLGHPLTKSEIEAPNSYNTYQINGLPPSPITNPGRASLEAVANPARTKELYFVADGNGGHVFSDTYAEHLKNVAKLREMQAGTVPKPLSAVPLPVARGNGAASKQ